MDELIKLMQTLLDESKRNAAQRPQKKGFTWKNCLIMEKSGWKASSYRKINEHSDGIIIIWEKEGHDKVEMSLSFREQCLWIQYIERKAKGEIR